MIKGLMNPAVDDFFGSAHKWKEEMEKLRMIVLDCGLTEELKWSQPCYTYQNSNVLIISSFKNYCILGFFKGVLLSDSDKMLSKPGEHTQEGRQMRFTTVQEIVEKETVIKAYIYEAIEVEKAGLKVPLKKTSDYEMPEELKNKFVEIPALKTAFEALTPGRQRAYLLYFSEPKQAKTRDSRIEKYLQHILNGKGLTDRYM